jgi:hypothetical protein
MYRAALDSSHLVNLDKVYLNDTKEKEIRSRTYNQQQQNNTHTFQRWKQCNHTNHSISYRTRRVRPLLAYNFKHGSYILSWMRQHHNTTALLNVTKRRNLMSSIPCRYCGNHIVFDDNVLSKRGKKIPLQEWNLQPHDCRFSPYHRGKSDRLKARAIIKEAISKIDDYQIREDAARYIKQCNTRLSYCQLQLIVNEKGGT